MYFVVAFCVSEWTLNLLPGINICPVGFRHPPEQLPSGDITKVFREIIGP